MDLSMGHLYLPPKHGTHPPLLIFFHGPAWLVETAAQQNKMASLSLSLGSGSSVYEKPFLDPTRFLSLIDEAQKKSSLTFGPITVAGWSAGGGAIRQILLDPASFDRIQRVIDIDGIHASYTDAKPGPLGSVLEPTKLESILHFAREAVAGRKTLLITHTEIFPGTYASTTETAHYIAQQLSLTESPILCWGSGGTQGISLTHRGQFTMIGYAGNSAPDHIDQIHALSSFLKGKPLTKSCAKP